MSFLTMFSSLFKSAPRAVPAEYVAKIRSGEALLVDVREPDEWTGGVAHSATLLPLSDLRGARTRWREFLREVGQREVLLYCASGMRSGIATRILESEGIRVLNTGGLADWARADWPIVRPQTAV